MTSDNIIEVSSKAMIKRRNWNSNLSYFSYVFLLADCVQLERKILIKKKIIIKTEKNFIVFKVVEEKKKC